MKQKFKLSAIGAGLLAIAPLALAIPASSPASAQAGYSGGEIAGFYRARAGRPMWFGPNSAGAADALVRTLSSAQADGLNPNRYRVRQLVGAVRAAQRGNPAAIQRAEAMLSEALVAYAQDLKRDPNVGIIYVDPELRPTPPSAAEVLSQAAAAPSLSDYVQKMGWMNPVYAQLRQALAMRMYRSEVERRVLAINLERARALPSGNQRYIIVNPAAQRLYMYENGQVVDQMRVIAGRPDPIAQTPMMNAYMRFVVLNPYWNSPADVTAQKLAPNVLKRGTAYLNEKGYQVMSDWSDNARVVDPKTVNWKAVAAGTNPIRLRQKPGPANSMGRMKFMFPNKQGIWLHDTPVKELLDEAARLQSAGCVRLQDAPRLARWLFGRPLKAAGTRPEQQVALAKPVPIYITYLTAVPSGSSIVFFDDLYRLDSRVQTRRG